MNTTVAKPQQARSLRTNLESDAFRDQIAKVLPKHLKADRMIRVAITALTRTPKLMDCTQESFFQCMLDLSAFGLEPDGRRAHLIPYGKVCTLLLDYKGIVELIIRSGAVSNIHADVVCDGDQFLVDKGELAHHVVDYRKPRGTPYAVYCLVRLKDGTEKVEVMTRDEVEAVRARSKASKSGPWVTDWNEMAKKTVFRRLSKWIPFSAELRDAIEADDDQFDLEQPTVEASGRNIRTVDDLADHFEKQDQPNIDADSTPAPDQDSGIEPGLTPAVVFKIARDAIEQAETLDEIARAANNGIANCMFEVTQHWTADHRRDTIDLIEARAKDRIATIAKSKKK